MYGTSGTEVLEYVKLDGSKFMDYVAAVSVRISRGYRRSRQHYKQAGLWYRRVCFLTPHPEHHTELKNIWKVNVRSPASYYAIRYLYLFWCWY